jgi:hypothetical protein
MSHILTRFPFLLRKSCQTTGWFPNYFLAQKFVLVKKAVWVSACGGQTTREKAHRENRWAVEEWFAVSR